MRADGRQLGFLPEEDAGELARILDAGGIAWAEISALTGGTMGKPTRGVNIHVHYIEAPSPGQKPPSPEMHGKPVGCLTLIGLGLAGLLAWLLIFRYH